VTDHTETVAITIPAALYTAIYAVHGEASSAVITRCLSQFIDTGSPIRSSVEETRGADYPRPKPGTITGRVWSIADQLASESGAPTRDAVVASALSQGINVNTASTQYSHWKKSRVDLDRKPARMAKSEKGQINLPALGRYLKAVSPELAEHTVTFAEIENVVGGPLPDSAYTFRQWWANQASGDYRPQARTWLEAGFEIGSVKLDRATGWIRFRRVRLGRT